MKSKVGVDYYQIRDKTKTMAFVSNMTEIHILAARIGIYVLKILHT